MTATATTGRPAWLEWRRGGIGGSDIAAVCGLSKWGSPFSTWASKTGLLPDSEPTPRQRLGQLLEPVIATLFHEDIGLYVIGEQTWCEHSQLSWARCTVDGFAAGDVDTDVGDALGTHQIKTDARGRWSDVPVDIRAQCVWEMGVTGMERCWLSVLHGRFDFHVYELVWDADAVEDWTTMRDLGDRFWHEYVLPGEMPPLDNSEATARALAAAFPDAEPGRRVALDDLADVLRERDDLAVQERWVERRKRHIDNMIKGHMGDAEVGTLYGEPLLAWRVKNVRAYEVPASSRRELRAATKADREAS